MDVICKLIAENKELTSILLTLLLGFLAWISKELIESPREDARETFFGTAEKRIQALSLLYNYLNAIAFKPCEKKLKEDLKKVILSDKLAYIDESTSTAITAIAFQEKTNEKLLLTTREEIREELSKCAKKIQEENQHFISKSTPKPYKRMLLYFIQLSKVLSFLFVIICIVLGFIKLLSLLFIGWNMLIYLAVLVGIAFPCLLLIEKWICN